MGSKLKAKTHKHVHPVLSATLFGQCAEIPQQKTDHYVKNVLWFHIYYLNQDHLCTNLEAKPAVKLPKTQSPRQDTQIHHQL